MEQTHHETSHQPGRSPRPARRTRKRRVPTCPYCRESDEVIPILYGFPSDAAFMRAERGEVYLGGYEVTPYSHYCKRDDREF